MPRSRRAAEGETSYNKQTSWLYKEGHQRRGSTGLLPFLGGGPSRISARPGARTPGVWRRLRGPGAIFTPAPRRRGNKSQVSPLSFPTAADWGDPETSVRRAPSDTALCHGGSHCSLTSHASSLSTSTGWSSPQRGSGLPGGLPAGGQRICSLGPKRSPERCRNSGQGGKAEISSKL